MSKLNNIACKKLPESCLNSRMRVLLLTTSFPLSQGSSSGIFIERLAHRLGQRCDLHVLAPAGLDDVLLPGSTPYDVSTFKYAPKRWRFLAHGGGGIPAALGSNPWMMVLVPLFVFAMIGACFRHARKADLIFANWSICGVVAGISGHLLGVPVVTTVRGEDANRASSSWVHRRLIGACLMLGGRLVTVSNDIAASMKQMFPSYSQKVVMIANGVDFPADTDQSVISRERQAINLIVVGSLIPRKSVETVIRALAELPGVFNLTVLGSGPERENLVSVAAELNVSQRVNFAGHVPPERVHEWLAKADIFIIASHSEGRPNALLEAMAASLPVVASDIPGVRELVLQGKTGLVFPAGDAEKLAECVRALKTNERRTRFGSAARQEIVDRGLTWDNCAENYLHEFQALLSQGQS